MPSRYEKDPYKILGIPSTATTSQVKQAYRRLARKYHPDLNKDPHAIEQMKEINWANDILSDPQKRSLYDLGQASQFQGSYSRSTSYRSSPPGSPSESVHTAKTSYPRGCSNIGAVWIIIIVLLNVVRGMRPISQSNINYSQDYFTTQTAQVENVSTILGTLHILQTTGTASSRQRYGFLVTPDPTETALKDIQGHRDLRSDIVPGTQVWEWIVQYFPELTTQKGLSDEVTLITYDQIRGYQIKTRSLGDYRLYIDRYTKVILAEHETPIETITPAP